MAHVHFINDQNTIVELFEALLTKFGKGIHVSSVILDAYFDI